MKKKEWDKILQENLAGLSDEEKERAIDFYNEIYIDKKENGADEESIIAEFGDPVKAAEGIKNGGDAESFASKTDTKNEGGSKESKKSFSDTLGDAMNKIKAGINKLVQDCKEAASGMDKNGPINIKGEEIEIFKPNNPDSAERIKINVEGANVKIVFGESLEARFKKDKGGYTFTESGGELLISQNRPKGIKGLIFGDETDLEISLPARVFGLSVVSSSGNVGITGVQSDKTEVITVSGDINITSSIADTLILNTASGDIEAEAVIADKTFIISSASGNIKITKCSSVKGNIKNVSGNILTAKSKFSDLEAFAISGFLEMRQTDAESVSAKTVSGDIKLYINGDAKQYTVKQYSASGDIEYKYNFYGENLISAESTSGDIRIKFE